MATENFCIVLWLLPAEPARSFFEETIARLAGEWEAPEFTPHLTLGPGSVRQMERLEAPALALPVARLAGSAEFTKTLFLRFALTPALAELRRSLGMAAAGFDPHLSLLYREGPFPAKEKLAAELTLPFRSVLFTRVAAVRCPGQVASRADVESWEELGSVALSTRPA